jgi:hypothetical protein
VSGEQFKGVTDLKPTTSEYLAVTGTHLAGDATAIAGAVTSYSVRIHNLKLASEKHEQTIATLDNPRRSPLTAPHVVGSTGFRIRMVVLSRVRITLTPLSAAPHLRSDKDLAVPLGVGEVSLGR